MITSSNSYILVSTLPAKYRTPDLLSPSKAPTAAAEAAYVALYSFVVSLVLLCGGAIAEGRLDRYLKRANADVNTPLDKTEKLLARMVKEGYLVKIRDNSGGEEVVEFMVGPRGKTEVGVMGMQGLVRTVYGETGGEDLEKRLQKSVGLKPPARSGRDDNSGDAT